MSNLLFLDKPFKMIAAATVSSSGQYVIGNKGSIPWSCPEDIDHFRQTTLGTDSVNAVIMGFNTWISLGKPLRGRLNVVITRKFRDQFPEGVKAFATLSDAYIWLKEQVNIDKLFIIGGGVLYQEAIEGNWCHELILTNIASDIDNDIDGDTFFPAIPSYYREEQQIKLSTCVVTTYHNYYTRHLEEQYLQQMNKLVRSPPRIGRNGSVHTAFQYDFKMDLKDGLPLFSTRRAFWKGICKELLFFIRGDTDSNHLLNEGISIWQGNTTREFLDSRGLNYEVGDMGPMYGWVWRNYGARYQGMTHNYKDDGYDQLRYVIDTLIKDPYNRRIMMTSYDPSKVSESVLAPCHSIVNHFYVRDVDGVKYLDMFTYQRSADMFLGVYFNIPSDATLQYIIAAAVGMVPGIMHIRFGDNHVYSNHLDALKEQLKRIPSETFPQLEITKPLHETSTEQAISWIQSLTYDDFKVHNYTPQKHIKAEMVA